MDPADHGKLAFAALKTLCHGETPTRNEPVLVCLVEPFL